MINKIICSAGLCVVFAQSCLWAQASVQIANQTYSAGAPVVVRAGNSVSTSGLVEVSNGANVTFQAGGVVTLSPGFSVAPGGSFTARITTNRAQFLRQTVPTQMTPGQVATVSIMLKNNGITPWTPAAGIKLGSQATENNTLWTGLSRVSLAASDSILPGQFKLFTFSITAPATPGTYSFQWMMTQDNVEWFGDASELVAISVGTVSNADSNFDGLPDSYTNDTNGDGVPDAVELLLGLDPAQPNPSAAARSKNFEYDALNRLRVAPGGDYNLDAEGNLKSVE